MVVAVGGDGTVHEVINGLMQLPAEKRPRLGVVPLGSGNDFAHALGVPLQAQNALRQVFLGQPRRIDVGRLQDNLGRVEYFDNTVGLGFDATHHPLAHLTSAASDLPTGSPGSLRSTTTP
jgi:diacylglycerol kinase family enzyme